MLFCANVKAESIGKGPEEERERYRRCGIFASIQTGAVEEGRVEARVLHATITQAGAGVIYVRREIWVVARS